MYSLLLAISIAVSVDLFLVCPRTQWKSNHCSIPWRWNGLPKPQADGRSRTDNVLCKNFFVHYFKPVARPKKCHGIEKYEKQIKEETKSRWSYPPFIVTVDPCPFFCPCKTPNTFSYKYLENPVSAATLLNLSMATFWNPNL